MPVGSAFCRACSSCRRVCTGLWRRGRRSGAAKAPFVLGDPRCISCAVGGAVSALRTAGCTFACGAGSPADRKTQREACKKFRLAQLPLAPQIGVGCAVLLIAVSCLYVGWRVMLPYDLDAPYACLSIKMNGTSGMPFSLKEDLAALPGVEEVSAAIDLTDTYTVTSDKIQSSKMLADIWVKDNGFYTGIPSLLQNAERGTLNTTVCALPEDELRRIAADAGVSDEKIETLLSGDSVLTLWGDCYYDPAADEYYQGFQPDGSTLVEPVFAAGDKLSIQYRRYTGQDEAGNEVYRTYTAQLPIAGVVKSARNYTLLTTDRLLFSGTILSVRLFTIKCLRAQEVSLWKGRIQQPERETVRWQQFLFAAVYFLHCDAQEWYPECR